MSRFSICGGYLIFTLVCSLKDVFSYQSFVSSCFRNGHSISLSPPRIRSSKLLLVENSLLTLTAGAIAGSIGVGVAYPLDALKTKAQTYASSQDSSAGDSIRFVCRGDYCSQFRSPDCFKNRLSWSHRNDKAGSARGRCFRILWWCCWCYDRARLV